MGISDQIRTNRENYDTEVNRIRADHDLSDEARSRKMRELHAKADARHRELIAQEQAAVRAESEQVYRDAFGLGFPTGVTSDVDKELFRMSYRQALSIAAATDKTKPDDLRDLRRRSEVTGDKLLVRATAVIAFERADRVVLDMAAEHDPNVRRLAEASVIDKRDEAEANVANSVRAPRLPAEARTDPAVRAA